MKSSPQIIETPELTGVSGSGAPILGGNLEVIQNVKVRLTVRIGETEASVGELLNMKSDHVLKLDTLVDQPVDVLLEGNVIARGELVAVEENFGIRITELPKTTGQAG